MSRILRELVGAREPAFSLRLRQLEAATGRRTVDITLTTDILSKVAEKIKALQLDPNDTTSEELYAAIIQKAVADDQLLARSYHGYNEKILEALNIKAPMSLIPVVKSSALRKIISACPPKKVMAALGFRSVASLLKRGDLDQVLVAAFLLESVTWHRAATKRLRALPPSDITMQRPKVVIIDSEIASKISAHKQPVYIQFAGLVGVIVPPKVACGSIVLAVQAIEGLYHVHCRGVLLKLHRFDEDFTKTLIKLTYTNRGNEAAINHIGVPWQSVYMSINGQSHLLSCLNESLVEPADFSWRLPNQALPLVHRGLDFWENNDILARPTTYRPISLSISDIALNAINLVPLTHSSSRMAGQNVMSELLSRYLRLDPNYENTMRNLNIIS